MKILLLFFIVSSVYSQTRFSEVYYPHINNAEAAITKYDFRDALLNYQKAFSLVKSPLARDLFNAALCKIKLNDFDGAKTYLLKLARCGVSIRNLELSGIFANNTKQWNMFKPIYIQILEGFVTAIPDEGLELIAQFENDKKENTQRLKQLFETNEPVIIKDGSQVLIKSDGSININGSENYYSGALSKIRHFLDSTRGFAEYQSGIVDTGFLLDTLNNIILSNVFRGNIKILELKHDSLVRKTMDTKKYLEEGIEAGKWHRDLMRKLNLSDTEFKISMIQVDEDCEGIKGRYFIKKPTREPGGFEEPLVLSIAKISFNLKEYSPFRLDPYPGSRLEVYATCKDARLNLAEWEQLDF